MRRRATHLRAADRAGLIVLCLLLALSVSTRLRAYGRGAEPEAGGVATVDLGDGVVLSRDEAMRRLVWTAACPLPVTADFVEPSPHGSDTSLAAPRNPDDRIVYVYQGWTLEGPRAAMVLSILHVLRRAGAVVQMSGTATRNALAVKLIVPAGCVASPDAVMAALRQGTVRWSADASSNVGRSDYRSATRQ